MRNPVGLGNAALLIVDWQLFFVSPSSPACLKDAALAEPNVEALVNSFLEAGMPVFATRHGHARENKGPFLNFYVRLLDRDDPMAALAPFLKEREGVCTVEKQTYSAFASSRLAGEFTARGIELVVIAGLQTDKCVLANALAAFDLGFRVIVASDACVARERGRHESALKIIERSCAAIASTREICGDLP